ncbi:MAG: nucleoside monophosphate kinase [Cyanobacteria bacterium SZAS LIN-3]|nr:nucleoside monophosphate kinase [Cyanobacteria bacterium SZAS LIN-3]
MNKPILKKPGLLAELWFNFRFFLTRVFVWPFRKPLFITLLGGPGAGKGTVAVELAPAHGIGHISTGALIRKEIADGTEIGRQVKAIVEAGGLAPDELVLSLLKRVLMDPKNRRGVVLDGYPRTLRQAQLLDQLLAGWGVSLTKAIWLELSEADLIERLSLRRTCSNTSCNRSYHLKFEPPKKDPNKCDACGSALIQRKDDAPDSIMARLALYREESAPLRKYYQDTKGGVLAFINPTNAMSKSEVLAKVSNALKDRS